MYLKSRLLIVMWTVAGVHLKDSCAFMSVVLNALKYTLKMKAAVTHNRSGLQGTAFVRTGMSRETSRSGTQETV